MAVDRTQIIAQIKKKKSFLCVGLDPVLEKMPPSMRSMEDPIFEFNKRIVEATHDFCVAFKPNLAFYLSHGEMGLRSLKKTLEIIPKDLFVIADAKVGDIGHTSGYYAKTYFEEMHFDAITISPYMGKDTVEPFLRTKGKWAIVLILTSNEGALDFQFLRIEHSEKSLYAKVLEKSLEWGNAENMMFVVGATKPEMIEGIRKMCPDHFFLIPGYGFQGGKLNKIAEKSMNKDCGILVNSARSILYTSQREDFAAASRSKAMAIQTEMEEILKEKGII